MNHNQNLFFYGMKANLVQMAGVFVGVFSFLLVFVHWLLMIIGIIAGIVIFFYGKSMRFDYKMQSGSIIHRGDWN